MVTANKYILATFGLFGFIFWHLADQMLQIRPDGWYVGQVNLYGDLVFHIGLINKFLESDKFLPDSPIFAGSKVNYPIFADFITAQISKISDIDFALFITTLLGGLLSIFVARLFILKFIKNEKIVFLTLLIFFINGGLGFYYFFQDYFLSQKPILEFLSNLPQEYTDIKEKGYWWINTYLAYFLPQRGFLFAFPQTLTVIMLLHSAHTRVKRNYFILAGILAGALVLVQTHSLFLIFLLSIGFAPMSLFLSKNKKEILLGWLLFMVITALIAIPILNSISQTQNPLKFIRFDPGWTSEENIAWFWLKNLGLFGPLLIISLVWLFKENRYLFTLYLPFLAVFIISNLFVFQPWDFDNSKLLVYWFFVSSIIVAHFIDYLFFQKGLKRILGIIVIFFMIFAGALDLFRTFTPPTSYRIFTKEDLEIAAAVKNLTAKDTIFVTSADHNHPIPALAGRSTLLGFHGWAWSHGLDYQARAADVSRIFEGGKEAEDLISFYKIDYVTIGPWEDKTFKINQNYFEKYPVIMISPGWQIYDVSNLRSDGNRQN